MIYPAVALDFALPFIAYPNIIPYKFKKGNYLTIWEICSIIQIIMHIG